MGGAFALLESLSHNTTLKSLHLVNRIFFNHPVRKKINKILHWNHVGRLSPLIIADLPLVCKERVILLFLILSKLFFCRKLHENVINMLKVSDFVKDGDPNDRATWK